MQNDEQTTMEPEITLPVLTNCKKFGSRDAAKEYAHRELGIVQSNWDDHDNHSGYTPLCMELPVAKITRTTTNGARLRWDPKFENRRPKMIGM